MPQPDTRSPHMSQNTRIVPLTAHDAFTLFVEDLPRWWPRARHSLANGPLRVDARKGGQIVETLPDGTTSAWARITAWDPGAKLGLIWHPGNQEAEGDAVEIRFRQLESGTEVTITHTISPTLPSRAPSPTNAASRPPRRTTPTRQTTPALKRAA